MSARSGGLGRLFRRAWPAALALPIAFGPAAVAGAQPPLFAFAQFSDVQANEQIEFDRFDQVLGAIVAAGQPGALLPQPVAFVLIAGDHVVEPRSEAEWSQYQQTVAANLTGQGIPFLAVPGNHDQDEFGTPLYAQYIAPPGVWDVSSAEVRGHNGLTAATGWAGLRLVGVNNSWAGFNTVRPADLAQAGAIVSASAGAGENVILVTHHPHDDEGVVPLSAVLETPGLVGYARGHTGTPHATQGLVGIANPVWDLSSESVMRDAALIYYEVFQTEIRAYVLKLAEAPVALPAPAVIALPHALWPASPTAPAVAFTEAPNDGRAPREVAFADLSSNDPTSWLWDFGDGSTSTERHPIHVYADGGSYDVSLVATNGQGGDAQTHLAEIQLLPPLPSLSFTAIADARVSSGSPTQNFGSASTIRARLASATTDQSYLRFSVSGLGDQRVVGAVLRVFVTDPSVEGGQVTAAPGGWDETTITWDNAPGIGATVLDAKGTVFPDTWVEFDVGSLVTGDGIYDFGLSSTSSNSVFYSSREGASPAQLVVFLAPAVPSLGAAGMAALGGLLVALGSRALARRPAR